MNTTCWLFGASLSFPGPAGPSLRFAPLPAMLAAGTAWATEIHGAMGAQNSGPAWDAWDWPQRTGTFQLGMRCSWAQIEDLSNNIQVNMKGKIRC